MMDMHKESAAKDGEVIMNLHLRRIESKLGTLVEEIELVDPERCQNQLIALD